MEYSMREGQTDRQRDGVKPEIGGSERVSYRNRSDEEHIRGRFMSI